MYLHGYLARRSRSCNWRTLSKFGHMQWSIGCGPCDGKCRVQDTPHVSMNRGFSHHLEISCVRSLNSRHRITAVVYAADYYGYCCAQHAPSVSVKSDQMGPCDVGLWRDIALCIYVRPCSTDHARLLITYIYFTYNHCCRLQMKKRSTPTCCTHARLHNRLLCCRPVQCMSCGRTLLCFKTFHTAPGFVYPLVT